MIETYLRAYQTAELDERVARIEQLSDAELVRIATGDMIQRMTARAPRQSL